MPKTGEKLLQNFFALHGVPEKSIGDITISDITLEVQGGGSEKDANRVEVPEYIDYGQYYSEPIQLRGELPSCGFYARHIKRLKLENFYLQVRENDARPAMFLYDIGELTVRDCKAYGQLTGFIRLLSCPNLGLRDCSINGEQVCEVEKITNEMSERMDSFKNLTWETHMLFEELSEMTNAAEKKNILGEIPADAWEGNRELSAYAVIPYGTHYVHIPRLYGDMELVVEGKTLGKISIPDVYRTAIAVSFKMPHEFWEKKVKLSVVWADPSDIGGFEAKMPFGDDFKLMSVGLYSNLQFRG